MKTFWNIDKKLTVLNEWQPNCWIQVTCPTDEDQRLLEEEFKIPDYFLSDISDTDERARYEYDDGWMLIILRIPYVKEIRSRTPYTTVPLGIIHKRDVTITVCYYETNMMIDFVSYQQKRNEGFLCRMVSETIETNQLAHRESQAQSGPRSKQRELDRTQPPARLSHLLQHFNPRQ